MNGWALWKRWVGEARWLWLACAVGLFAFCWIRVWLVTQLTTGSFSIILEQVWEKYEKFSPVPLRHLLTYHGRVGLAFEELFILFGIAVWAIARGSDAIAGQIQRGEMELILAQPLSRRAVFATQAGVTLLGLVLLASTVWAGMASGIATVHVREERLPSFTIPGLGLDVPVPIGEKRIDRVPMRERTRSAYFMYPTINLFCFGVLLSGLSTLLSACDRLRWRTIGLVSGFVVVQMVLRIVSMASESFGWLRYATCFTAYQPELIVSIAVDSPNDVWSLVLLDGSGQYRRLGPLAFDLILLVPGVGCYIAGLVVFLRRDLPAPA